MKTTATKQELLNKAEDLCNKLSNEDLKKFSENCPIEIFGIVMEVLEKRIPEKEFIQHCNFLSSL